jgi:hypothetical protein
VLLLTKSFSDFILHSEKQSELGFFSLSYETITMSFTDQQMFAISTAERLCATISLVGTSIIIVTFLGSKSFRKPVNRLAFYASWGNILSNTGQLIADSGINHGVRSSLCQFQGCLLQWFVSRSDLDHSLQN